MMMGMMSGRSGTSLFMGATVHLTTPGRMTAAYARWLSVLSCRLAYIYIYNPTPHHPKPSRVSVTKPKPCD